MFFPPREDRLLGGGPDIFHPRSGGNWWKLVQREPQYGDPYAVTREGERESFHAKRIFHGDDLYLYRDVGYNLGPRFELTSSSPSRILLSLSLDATAIIPALVSDFGKH